MVWGRTFSFLPQLFILLLGFPFRVALYFDVPSLRKRTTSRKIYLLAYLYCRFAPKRGKEKSINIFFCVNL